MADTDLPDRFSLLEVDADAPRQIEGHMQPPSPPVQQLVLRFEQLAQDGAVLPPPDPETPDAPVYRMVKGGMVLCARHARELAAYMPHEQLRTLLTDDQIDSLVAEFGLLRDDIVALYGHADWTHRGCCDRCALCGVHPNTHKDGSPALCHSDDCQKPLHPQWPAVYCSDECADRDR